VVVPGGMWFGLLGLGVFGGWQGGFGGFWRVVGRIQFGGSARARGVAGLGWMDRATPPMTMEPS
jgi:hypothetical protein